MEFPSGEKARRPGVTKFGTWFDAAAPHFLSATIGIKARRFSSPSRIETQSLQPAMSKQELREKFNDVYKLIREELVAHIRAQGMPEDAVEWYARNLDYNTPGGKLNRGLSVVDSAKILLGDKFTDEHYKQAAILGWCVELLQAFFLVSDDIMDSSITRRGQPCWYRTPNVGMIAINDAFMLEAAIYHLLKVRGAKEHLDAY